jgi:hypothetical protein
MKEILMAKARVTDSYVFPAKGLTLVGVDYPSTDELASLVAFTPDTRIPDDE